MYPHSREVFSFRFSFPVFVKVWPFFSFFSSSFSFSSSFPLSLSLSLSLPLSNSFSLSLSLSPFNSLSLSLSPPNSLSAFHSLYFFPPPLFFSLPFFSFLPLLPFLFFFRGWLVERDENSYSKRVVVPLIVFLFFVRSIRSWHYQGSALLVLTICKRIVNCLAGWRAGYLWLRSYPIHVIRD